MNILYEEITIKNEQGLHARPAALFVEIVNKYNINVRVRKKDLTVDGKSIMGLLMLEAGKGTKVELIIEGKEAEAALKEFKELLKDEHISE